MIDADIKKALFQDSDFGYMLKGGHEITFILILQIRNRFLSKKTALPLPTFYYVIIWCSSDLPTPNFCSSLPSNLYESVYHFFIGNFSA